MKVKTLMLGTLQTNVYVVYNEDSKDAVVIDPAAEADRIIDFIEEYELKLMGLLVTHSHYDHILAVDSLRERYGIPVFTSKGEREIMADPSKNHSLMFSRQGVKITPNEEVGHGDILEFGELVFHCIQVPGHSIASICYYSREHMILFCGDTLFASSIGRTDLFHGPHSTLVNEIKKHLLCLPEDTKVYPGHGLHTTIGYEKKTNPYL